MIYFCQSPDGGTIKIGCSDDVPTRIRQLESHYGRPLALLATMDGGRDEERAIHERFVEHRLGRTEQFRPVAEIMAFIGRPLLVSPDPDAVEAMPKTPGRLDVVIRHARIELPDDDYERLKRAAKRFHISVAAYIRQAVMERIESDEARGGSK